MENKLLKRSEDPHLYLTIETRNGRIRVNKLSLINRSVYFANMVECDMIEAKTNIIKFHHISYKSMKEIIFFLQNGFTNKLSRNTDVESLWELIENSHLLGITELFEQVWFLLLNKPTSLSSGFWDIWHAAELYNRKNKDLFIILWFNLDNVGFDKTSKFSFEDLNQFLNHVKYYPSNDALLNFLFDWAIADIDDRISKVESIINKVDFTSISYNYIQGRRHQIMGKSQKILSLFFQLGGLKYSNINKDNIEMCIYTVNDATHQVSTILYQFRYNLKLEDNWSAQSCKKIWNYFGVCKQVFSIDGEDFFLVRFIRPVNCYQFTINFSENEFNGRNQYCLFNRSCIKVCQFESIFNQGQLGLVDHGHFYFQIAAFSFIDIDCTTNSKKYLSLKCLDSTFDNDLWIAITIVNNKIYFISISTNYLLAYDVTLETWTKTSPMPSISITLLKCYCFNQKFNRKLYFVDNYDNSELITYDINLDYWLVRKFAALSTFTPLCFNCDLNFILGNDKNRRLWIYHIDCDKITGFTGFLNNEMLSNNFLELRYVDSPSYLHLTN